jgi:hypothetical protein
MNPIMVFAVFFGTLLVGMLPYLLIIFGLLGLLKGINGRDLTKRTRILGSCLGALAIIFGFYLIAISVGWI